MTPGLQNPHDSTSFCSFLVAAVIAAWQHSSRAAWHLGIHQLLELELGAQSSPKNFISHIDASLSRQPLVKGERLVRYEVNAVMLLGG